MTRLLHAIYCFAYYVGIIRLFYWINRNAIIVLTYHNVLPDRLFDSSPHLGVSHSESAFRTQMRLIRQRFRPSKWPAAPGGCVVTFDDGYKNQWRTAGPILAEFEVPAVFFVSFQPMEDGKCLKVDQILKWVSYVSPGRYSVCGQEILVAGDERQAAFNRIYNHLIRKPADWSIICSELDNAAKLSDLKFDRELDDLRFQPLNAGELAEMRAAGHQIGCHSWDHRPLGSLEPAQLADDFVLCVSRLDSYANTRLYSYPFGSSIEEVSNEAVLKCAEYGFQWAFLNCRSIPDLTGKPDHALPRTSLPNTDDRYVLEAKLSGFESTIKRLLRS